MYRGRGVFARILNAFFTINSFVSKGAIQEYRKYQSEYSLSLHLFA